MSSLSELLAGVLKLPEAELERGRPEAERPEEMELLGKVISKDEISAFRERGIWIKRASFIRSDGSREWPEIQFQVTNGEPHTISAALGAGDGLVVTEGKRVLPISTVAELRKYIMDLAMAKPDTT